MCEYCEKPNKTIATHSLGVSAFVGAGCLLLRFYDEELNATIVSESKINFCPMCRRKLTKDLTPITQPHSSAKENKMAKNNELKKAATLAKKLIVDRDRILKSSDKIQKILLTTDLVIGGYKMVQKLRKQKNLFDELADVMNKRIELFKNAANAATEEKSSNVAEKK